MPGFSVGVWFLPYLDATDGQALGQSHLNGAFGYEPAWIGSFEFPLIVVQD